MARATTWPTAWGANRFPPAPILLLLVAVLLAIGAAWAFASGLLAVTLTAALASRSWRSCSA